jgi:hypothetical protein
MKEGHFLSTQEVERFLQFKPVKVRDIVLELRNLVASVAPEATERILWKGLSYHDGRRGGPVKGGICQIEIHADRVRLSFIHGAFLQDPEGLLEGDRLAKRFIEVMSYDQAPWSDLKYLIEESARFDPSSIQGS